MLSLTGCKIEEKDLDKCHRLKKNNGTVIVEFNNRSKRDPVIFGRKALKDKKDELKRLKMEQVIIAESLCVEYKHLDFLCRKLKKKNLIADTWFFMGSLMYVKGPGDDTKHEVKHINDLYATFGKEVIDSLSD